MNPYRSNDAPARAEVESCAAHGAAATDATTPSAPNERAQRRNIKILMVDGRMETRDLGPVRGRATSRWSGLVAENDAAARQVVRRNFDGDAIALEHADAKAPHVATEGREHGV